jgi:type IV pilus assembly protein PilB
MDKNKLGEMLVKAGKITDAQLKTAVQYQASLGGKLGTILVKLRFIGDDPLTEFLAENERLKITPVGDMVIPGDLVKKVPREIMEKHQCLPVSIKGDTLTLCLSDPYDYDAIQEVEFTTGLRVDVTIASRAAITKALTQFFDEQERAPKAEASKGTRTASEPALRALAAGKDKEPGTKAVGQPSKWQLRRALIPLLIKKGIITEAELRDAAKELEG